MPQVHTWVFELGLAGVARVVWNPRHFMRGGLRLHFWRCWRMVCLLDRLRTGETVSLPLQIPLVWSMAVDLSEITVIGNSHLYIKTGTCTLRAIGGCSVMAKRNLWDPPSPQSTQSATRNAAFPGDPGKSSRWCKQQAERQFCLKQRRIPPSNQSLWIFTMLIPTF